MVELEMMVDGLPPQGTSYPHTDFAAIATAAGARGIRVEKPGEVRSALREAFSHPGPVLVDVVTDPNALSIPPKITAGQITGFALSASRTVLNGGVGRMVQLARSNLRNIPRP
jgi:pyruvate dehydrogenase (quinone)